MNSKQDRVTPRTAGDIDRKYGENIKKAKKAVESQKADLAALIIKLEKIVEDINEVNKRINEISLNYTDLNESIEILNNNSHTHKNKKVLDMITEEDISNWNDKIDGSYNILANSLEVSQVVESISNYNLILVSVANIARYVPCYKYQNSYKGIVLTTENEQLVANEIEITFEEETIIDIKSNYDVLEVIGIF